MKRMLRLLACSHLPSRPASCSPVGRAMIQGSLMLLLAGIPCPPATGQSVPADVAARDQLQAAQRLLEVQRAMEVQRQAQDRTMNDLRERFVTEAWLDESAEKLKSLVLLPPLPPALGQVEPDLAAPVYPVLLAEYAGETFFMAHGRLYFRRQLNPAQVRQIAGYRDTRDRLTGELRQALVTAGQGPAADSARFLAAFAARQEPALQALETQAESIRRRLADLDDGTALLQLEKKVLSGQPAALGEYFAAIHAVHFQDGLSLAQRQLLLEIALDALRGSPDPGDPVDCFLPSAARLRWPDDPSGTLAPLLSEFRGRRESLKAELREQVVLAAPAGHRAKRHAALAAQQAARFDELHRFADRIRTLAAGLTDPGQPGPSAFPPALVRLVGQAVAARHDFQTRAKRTLAQLDREFAPLRFKLVVRDQLPVIEVPPAGDLPVPKAVPARLQEINMSFQANYRELAADMEAARLALHRHRETLGPDAPEAGKLSAQLAQTHDREENWRRYADYRTAVLTPGLSPAQRRLLLNAALRDLEKHRLQNLD